MRAAVRVLDSYSLIAYIEGEVGKDTMIEVFRSARDSGRAASSPSSIGARSITSPYERPARHVQTKLPI